MWCAITVPWRLPQCRRYPFVSPFAATFFGAIDILDGAVVVVERNLAVLALIVFENTLPPLIADALAVR